MSWTEFRARKAVLDAVLEQARVVGPDHLNIDRVPDVERLFGGGDNVLLALAHKWNTHLQAKLENAIDTGLDPAAAWTELAAEQPTLRAVLDIGARRSAALREAARGEARTIHATTALVVPNILQNWVGAKSVA
jgi:hypothetical protein